MSISNARSNLADVINKARYTGTSTVLTHKGSPVAQLTPVDAETVTDAALAAVAAWDNFLDSGAPRGKFPILDLKREMENLRKALGARRA